jgi:dihydroorotate dehydrogenase (fumarate)
MTTQETSYMGLSLKNPIIAGASYLTADLDSIKKLEDGGAAAIVVKSLFEEEIQLQSNKLDEDLVKYNNRYAEMIDFFPQLGHAGPDEHLMWIAKTKEAVSIPVIASLNAVSPETWTAWAKKIEQTGADGIELNLIDFPEDYRKTGTELENLQLSIIKAVQNDARIPVSIKIGSSYTNPLNFIAHADDTHINGIVLFNRFFEPDIDSENQNTIFPFNLSSRGDYRRSLRVTGIAAGYIKADICGSCGILTGSDAIKMILAGAQCVQIVTALYQKGVNHIQTMARDIEQWMERKGYASLDAFRGKLRADANADPWAYSRSQYVKLLMRSGQVVENAPVL